MLFKFIPVSLLLIALSGCSSAHIAAASSSSPIQRQAQFSKALIIRAAWADRTEISDLVTKGANPNAATDQGITPLHLAITKGNLEAAAALLELGAQPNVVDELEFSPLRVAVENNDFKAAELLIAHGADPKYSPHTLKGPLFAAINQSNFEMIDLLVQNGADLNGSYFDGEGYIFPLYLSPNDETFEHLLKLGANPNIFLDQEKELSLLITLIGHKQTNRIAIALEQGADPNFRSDANIAIPLHFAARINYVDGIELLLRHGADLKAKDRWSLTALDHARNKSSNEAVAVLIKAGAR